jgi:GH15 family glucan-1,4-alpha-glucosidase
MPMPRDLPVGNGSFLVCFDHTYQIRDLYWPFVGQENHTVGWPHRVGVWVEGRFAWLSDPGWERDLRYQTGTLVTDVRLFHRDLGILLHFCDTVDFHENLFVRRCTIVNHADREREVRLLFHHDLRIMGHEVGDSAYYEPERRAVIHYKGGRWFLVNGAVPFVDEASGPGWKPASDTYPGLVVGVHQWACGHKGVGGREGTWRDAEDGVLSGNSVAQGSVDSAVGFSRLIAPRGTGKVYYWLCAGSDFESVAGLNRLVRQRGPQAFIDRTNAYWRLWLKSNRLDLSPLPAGLREHYLQSLLLIRTQTDNRGAIIAANDSDISSSVRDTYSYLWPRDGALVAHGLAMAGYIEIPRNFYNLAARVLTREGYLLHKYNPDGTLASSWHPWYRDGGKELPIQEDETALVLWALWHYFTRFGDVEFIKPLYRPLIVAAARFLECYRDEKTGLPLPSHDLWEERHGINAFTIGAVWGGLIAAANFAEAFGEEDNSDRFHQAAEDLQAATDIYLWSATAERFVRRLIREPNGSLHVDETIDASLAGLWLFGMYAPDDPRIVKTMLAVHEQLWVKTSVGGVARYRDDYYHQVTSDLATVPGNPWFVSTMWLAEWYAASAESEEGLQRALELLTWACDHALPSGVLAEQVHPHTGAPLSVSPLTWSHAGYVSAVQSYLKARERLLHEGRLNGYAGARASSLSNLTTIDVSTAEVAG